MKIIPLGLTNTYLLPYKQDNTTNAFAIRVTDEDKNITLILMSGKS